MWPKSIVDELKPVKPPLTPGQKKRRAADAKGKRLEDAIRAHLESEGWLVETAPKVVHWLFDPKLGRRVPRSSRRDFFEVWDGIAVARVRPHQERIDANCQWQRYQTTFFYQVTTLGEVSKKRRKIAASGFPVSLNDRIYGYEGRPRRWRVLYGPAFEMPGETIQCSAPQPKEVIDAAR